MIQSDACLVNGRMRGPQDTLSLPSKNGVQGPKDNPSIFGNIESTDNPTIVDGLLGGAEDTSGIFGNIDSTDNTLIVDGLLGGAEDTSDNTLIVDGLLGGAEDTSDSTLIVDGLLGGAEDTSGIFGNIDSESHEGTLIPPKKSFTNTTKTLL
jgi:hypothetical protein